MLVRVLLPLVQESEPRCGALRDQVESEDRVERDDVVPQAQLLRPHAEFGSCDPAAAWLLPLGLDATARGGDEGDLLRVRIDRRSTSRIDLERDRWGAQQPPQGLALLPLLGALELKDQHRRARDPREKPRTDEHWQWRRPTLWGLLVPTDRDRSQPAWPQLLLQHCGPSPTHRPE